MSCVVAVMLVEYSDLPEAVPPDIEALKYDDEVKDERTRSFSRPLRAHTKLTTFRESHLIIGPNTLPVASCNDRKGKLLAFARQPAQPPRFTILHKRTSHLVRTQTILQELEVMHKTEQASPRTKNHHRHASPLIGIVSRPDLTL